MKFDKVKTHIRKHKVAYILGGVCLAEFTALIMRDCHAVLQGGADGPDVATMQSIRGRHARILDGLDEVTVHPLVKESRAKLDAGMDWPEKAPTDSFSILSGNVTIGDNNYSGNIVNVLEREGRGHPGYIVYCKELKVKFPSQDAASKATGIPASVISEQITGKIPDAYNYHFARVAA